jgi:hypothetical protein
MLIKVVVVVVIYNTLLVDTCNQLRLAKRLYKKPTLVSLVKFLRIIKNDKQRCNELRQPSVNENKIKLRELIYSP